MEISISNLPPPPFLQSSGYLIKIPPPTVVRYSNEGGDSSQRNKVSDKEWLVYLPHLSPGSYSSLPLLYSGLLVPER